MTQDKNKCYLCGRKLTEDFSEIPKDSGRYCCVTCYDNRLYANSVFHRNVLLPIIMHAIAGIHEYKQAHALYMQHRNLLGQNRLYTDLACIWAEVKNIKVKDSPEETMLFIINYVDKNRAIGHAIEGD